jgi:hypothetical protein
MHITPWMITAALGVGLIATPAAVWTQGSVVLTPFAGGTVFTNQPTTHSSLSRGSRTALSITDGRYQDAVTIGTFAGIHFNPRWELETLISWTPTRLEARGGLRTESVAAHAYMYGIGVNYHFPEGGGVWPYISVGVGGETWVHDISSVPAQSHLMANVGGGIEFPLRERTVFRVDLRDCVSVHRAADGAEADAMSHIMLVAGLSFAFPNP